MRGKIKHRDFASQIRDFSGLRFGNITPTDIDGLIDYKDKAWILFELKFAGGEMPFGQRLALELITDNLARLKPTICFIAEHETEPPNDINSANTTVVMFRHKREWHYDNRKITLRKAIDGFLEKNCGTPREGE